MSDIETTVRNLAAIAAAKKLLAEAEAREKSALAGQIARGTAYAYTASGEELGYATVPKPTQPKPVVTITDEAQVFPWLVDAFGPEVIEQRVMLTEQGRASLEAFMLEEHKAAGSEGYFDLPGVSVSVPPGKGSGAAVHAVEEGRGAGARNGRGRRVEPGRRARARRRWRP
ncbi:hypothetical protein F8M49_21150 [Rhodococcus zopfii]|uniref:Uncharacterized protein n=1 Tax=Rhodococcus zopfii TaxID=43772 RepID=A0ABU3WTI2_9NOCA|nr:hypothetical protein [Rhodococcus zopfii]